MLSEDFYQQHLNRVSRSFAFCIAQLDLPLKAWVGLTYLLCRILDTIEDAPWPQALHQKQGFERFDDFLRRPVDKEDLHQWSATFPEDIPKGERLLLDQSHRIFSDLHASSPAPVRSIIQELGESMSAGMQHFMSRRKENGELRLRNLTEVNQYCFFVAGLVGEALARLMAFVEPQFRLIERGVLDAHHFGLFLQKVNLLKDQVGDQKEGRYFIPSRTEVFSSLEDNAEGALRFLNSIPLQQRNFRLFCAWSFFLGLKTLPLVETGFQEGRSKKLARKDTQKLMLQVEALIQNPEGLEALALRLGRECALNLSGWHTPGVRPSSSLDSQKTWFSDIYKGFLGHAEFKDLGLIENQAS